MLALFTNNLPQTPAAAKLQATSATHRNYSIDLGAICVNKN